MVGSTEEVKIGNKMAKARQYPWGVVQGMCASWGRDWIFALNPCGDQPCFLPLHRVWESVVRGGQVEGSSGAVALTVVGVGQKW